MAELLKAESWMKHIVKFRIDPRAFLNTHGIDETTFVINILQVLCDDGPSVTCRCHLLTLLQEYGAYLYTDIATVEQVVGSLLDAYRNADNPMAKSSQCKRHILITTTNLIIEHKFLSYFPAQCVLLVELLLEEICDVNSQTRDGYLRNTATECLTALEEAQPGFLLAKLEYIYQVMQMEKSWVHQGLSLLLSTVLLGTIQVMATTLGESFPDQALNDCLCKRTTPLKPFYIPTLPLQAQTTEAGRLPGNISTAEMEKCIGYVLAHIHLLCPGSVAAVIQNLISIAQRVPALNPKVFLPFVKTNLSSLDLQTAMAVIHILQAFPSAECFTEERKRCLRVLCDCINNSGLNRHHRVMLLQVLAQWKPQSEFPPSGLLSESNIAHMYPKMSDHYALQLHKLLTLNLMLSKLEPAVASMALMSALEPLRVAVTEGGGPEGGAGGGAGGVAQYARSLYAVLAAMYRSRPQSSAITDALHRLLVNLVQAQPSLAVATLAWIHNIEQQEPGAPLVDAVLKELAASVLSVKSTEEKRTDVQDMMSELAILEAAVSHRTVSAKDIVQYLRSLLVSTPQDDWALGTRILDVCSSLLTTSSDSDLYPGLGDVLATLMQSYDDIDVNDRATFLYALLTQLTHTKIQEVLSEKSQLDADNTVSIADMVKQRGLLNSCAPVTAVHSPFILTRIPASQERNHGDGKVMLCFSLQLGEGEFESVYAVVMKITADEQYTEMDDVYVPYLRKSSEPASINILLEPLEPIPTDLAISVLFSDEDGHTFACELPTQQVNIEDLFLPLPTPIHITLHTQENGGICDIHPQENGGICDIHPQENGAICDIHPQENGGICDIPPQENIVPNDSEEPLVDGAYKEVELVSDELDALSKGDDVVVKEYDLVAKEKGSVAKEKDLVAENGLVAKDHNTVAMDNNLVAKENNSVAKDYGLVAKEALTDNTAEEQGMWEEKSQDIPQENNTNKTLTVTEVWDKFVNDSEKFESVLYLNHSECTTQEVLKRHLGSFRLQYQEPKAWFFGLRLPPDSHAILRVQPNVSDAVVSIATEDIHLLPLLSDFVQRVFDV